MPKRVLKIDSLTRSDHYYLEASDVCYYAGEYTAGEGHAYSDTNQLIHNFKKTLDKKNTPQWQYKERAITQAAALLRSALKPDAAITFVPVPPSKAKSDPLYDDRMMQMLKWMGIGRQIDVRELVVQRQSVEAAHVSDKRPTPDQLLSNYSLNESLVEPSPQTIFIVDDVLTTGCHFKAMQQILRQRFPSAQIAGLFIARRAPKSIAMDFDDF